MDNPQPVYEAPRQPHPVALIVGPGEYTAPFDRAAYASRTFRTAVVNNSSSAAVSGGASLNVM